MNTTSNNPLTSSEIILICTTIGTLLISMIDLFVNSYIGVKKRHLSSSCCDGFLEMDYSSDDKTDEVDKNDKVTKL